MVYDTVLRGFGIRLSRDSKSFFAERRLNGKTKRITIGPYPHISVDTARKQAHIVLSELVQGIDRNAVDEDAKLKAVTLKEAFDEFERIKRPMLVERTLRDYESLLSRFLADCMPRPWVAITPQMVIRRHTEIREATGGPTANHTMRALGAVIHFSMKRFRDPSGRTLISECPTDILSDMKAWHPHKVRDRYVKPNELAAWWSAVLALENKAVGDLLILLVLTGFRLSEGMTLRWAQIDLASRTITLDVTKNKKKHVLPVSEYLHELLTRRKQESASDFVFPGPGEGGHVVEIRKCLRKVVTASGVEFSPHDLRRTFSNCLEMADVTYYAHKTLMNHASGGDVTFKHYLSINVERLREPMEKVTRYILRHAQVLPTADVVQFPAPQAQAAG